MGWACRQAVAKERHPQGKYATSDIQNLRGTSKVTPQQQCGLPIGDVLFRKALKEDKEEEEAEV